jgi:hypothetical protein
MAFGNMASPYYPGSNNYPAVTSAQIDILKEILTIRLNPDFSSAHYTAEYFVYCEDNAEQMPLLFIAEYFKDNFKIFVDDESIEINPIDYVQLSEFFRLQSNLASTFAQQFEEGVFRNNDADYAHHAPDDMKFFQVNLPKGTHTIRAEYEGKAHVDLWDWIRKYTFTYILEPAKHWKSFGDLEVRIINPSDRIEYTTSLGEKTFQTNDSTQIWQFKGIPADNLRIDFKPKTNMLASILLFIQPIGITFIIFILLLWLHIKKIRHFRVAHYYGKYSPPLIIGNLLIPFIVCIIYCFSYALIDFSIGDSASDYHGYFIIGVMLFFPILQILYSFSLWMYDLALKKKITKAHTNQVVQSKAAGITNGI